MPEEGHSRLVILECHNQTVKASMGCSEKGSSIVKFICCDTNISVSHFLSPPIPYSVLLGCYCF